MKRLLNKITAVTVAFAAVAGAMLQAQHVEAAEIPFLFQGQTCLEAGNDTFDFAVGDYNNDGVMDIYAIKKYNTGTGTTELHILDGSSNYQSFLLQTGLSLELGDNFRFAVGDYNGDGMADLFAIKKNAGLSRCEVHMLDGSSGYSRFLEQRVVQLEPADYWDFAVADYNGDGRVDLYAVKKFTSSGKCEVHILDGSSGYGRFLEQRSLPLETGSHFSFCTGDYNGDGRPDLYALKRKQTGTGTTEIHVLNGANGYQNFLQQSGVKLESGDNFVFASYDYNHNGCDELVAVKKRAVTKTEVHILNVSGKSGKTNANNGGSSGWDARLGSTPANIGSYFYKSGNLSYPNYTGQCTWYAFGRFYEVCGIKLKTARHAQYWLNDNAGNPQVSVIRGGSNIREKSIAVRTTGPYGHVMFIEHVAYSGGVPQYVYFTECNTDGNGRYDPGKYCILKKLSYSAFLSQKNPVGYITAR